ncbi:hypothetical protein EDD85DRAFT_989032 [Armillaria nabsnona]|nr:hypothetical protein EDD85DRAFT_989032 [Armillaria nabsnona]
MSEFKYDQDPAVQFLNGLISQSPNDPLPAGSVHGHESPSYMPPEDSRQTESPSQDGFPESPFHDGAMDDLPPPPPPSLQSSLAAHVRLVKLLKQNKKFSRESVKDLHNFAAAPMIEECLVIILAATLETCDLLMGLQEKKVSEVWEVKDSLKKFVKCHAKAFVLSSSAKSFTGKGTASAVMDALWANNVKEMPAEKDITGCSILLSFISDELSSARSTVKTKLNETLKMKADNEDRNIAGIAAKLAGDYEKTKIPVMLQLYMCLAVVHWHLVTYPSMAKPDVKLFWKQVDNSLAMWLKNRQESYTRALNGMYKMDKEKYGDPANLSRYKAIDPDDPDVGLAKWIRTANKGFDKICPEFMETSGGKQKRAIEDEGDDD